MTTTRAQRSQPKIRLLWDECLSSQVPAALRVLDFHTSWIGDVGTPPTGSTDKAIIEFAKKTNQVIVTLNHDMMMLCDEADQRFVWLDQRGVQLTREAQVLLVFKQISEWERLLEAQPPTCVRALRTKCKAVTGAEAARIVAARTREIRRRKNKKRHATRDVDPGQMQGL